MAEKMVIGSTPIEFAIGFDSPLDNPEGLKEIERLTRKNALLIVEDMPLLSTDGSEARVFWRDSFGFSNTSNSFAGNRERQFVRFAQSIAEKAGVILVNETVEVISLSQRSNSVYSQVINKVLAGAR